MPRSSARASDKRPPEFEQDVAKLLGRLRDAYADLLRALPGPIDSGADLQRATKLDMKICWKVHRVVSAPDALSAAPYVLGPANTETFLHAVEKLGAPAAAVQRAARYTAELATLIREHARDRKTFESMVSTWSSSPQQRVNQRERKAAFKANCHIFGVSVDTMAICTAIRPAAADPRMLDKIALGSEFGLRRLRRTNFPLFSKWLHPFDSKQPTAPGQPPAPRTIRRPIDASLNDDNGLGLLVDFSSRPTPELVSSLLPDGRSMVRLAHDRVGSKAAVDISLGMMLENAPARYRRGSDSWHLLGTQIVKPCQAVVIDVLVERGTFDRLTLEGRMTASRLGPHASPADLDAGGRLEDDHQVASLGRGADVLGLSEVPEYRRMIEWTFDKVGWDLGQFDVYRYRVEYPLTLSTVFVSHDLPDEPGTST